SGLEPRPTSRQVEEQVNRVEPTAGQAADHGAVDPDVLQVVAGMLLDESHRALRAEGVDAALDERRDARMVTLDHFDGASLDPAVEASTQLLVGGDLTPEVLEARADPRHRLRTLAGQIGHER